MLNRRLSISLTVILATIFVVGFGWMLLQRFQKGDVYPPYSSLRTDPLGCKVFLEALAERPGVTVRRNFKPLDRLVVSENTTLFYIGTKKDQDNFSDKNNPDLNDDSYDSTDSPSLKKTLATMAKKGARVVIAFLPQKEYNPHTKSDSSDSDDDTAFANPSNSANREVPAQSVAFSKLPEFAATKKPAVAPPQPPISGDPKDQQNQQNPTTKKSGKHDKKSEKKKKKIDPDLVWDILFRELKTTKNKTIIPKLTAHATPLAAGFRKSLSWHTALYFQFDSKAWKTLYRCKKNPVIIERKFGRGSIVFVADSYLLSNEALRKQPSPRLLLWLAGDLPTSLTAKSAHKTREIVFEESHLGVKEDENIATLAWHYHLQLVAASLLLLAALFIWKNASSLLPPHEDEPRSAQVKGLDSASGFVNLLRRSIPAAKLPAVCVAEWKKSFGNRFSAKKLREIEAAAAANQDPEKANEIITNIIHPKS